MGFNFYAMDFPLDAQQQLRYRMRGGDDGGSPPTSSFVPASPGAATHEREPLSRGGSSRGAPQAPAAELRVRLSQCQAHALVERAARSALAAKTPSSAKDETETAPVLPPQPQWNDAAPSWVLNHTNETSGNPRQLWYVTSPPSVSLCHPTKWHSTHAFVDDGDVA